MRYICIEATYMTLNDLETKFFSEELDVDQGISIAEDFIKTGRVSSISFIDNNDRKWSLKELKKYVEGIQTEPHNVKAYFDGNFDRKTNIAGLGCVIYYDQNNQSHRIRKNALIEEIETSNEAEYAALHFTVKEIDGLGVHYLPVQIYGDSLTVINQMKDEWACYEQELIAWADRIDTALEKIGVTAQYEVIPRSNNKEADQLATQALNRIEIISTKEIDR